MKFSGDDGLARHPALMLMLRLCRAGLVCLFAAPLAIFAQANPSAPCGVVDALDYPIDISDTLETSFDDFSRYRQRFGGLHVGVDPGFRRQGKPVRARH